MPRQPKRERSLRNYQGRKMARPTLHEDWMEDAACAPQNARGAWDPHLHFDARMTDVAVAMCRACPVIAKCRAFARDNSIIDGIWGGLDFGEVERSRLRAQAGGA